MIDNSVMRSLWAISEISTDEIGVTHILRDFQLSDMSDRLHEVAKNVTFWKEKPISLAVDSYRTIEAAAKLTAALFFQQYKCHRQSL